MMPGKNVLVFAPYGSWRIHHELDAVISTSLRLRGAEVRALLCDGLFKDCPIAGKPPAPDTCRVCAAGGSALFTAWQIPVTQMRGLLEPRDYADADEWSASLPVSGLANARFEGVPLGDYVRSSVHSYFMVGEVDYSNDRMPEVNRHFLYNAALIVRAFAKVVREFPPDHVLLFNGVHAYYRVFFELCRAAGIPVLVHERGLIDDSFLMLANQTQGDHIGRIESWKPWSSLPLDADECRQVKEYFMGREEGRNTNTDPIYAFRTAAADARKRLRIPDGKKVVGLFTSSDWEVGISRTIFRMTFRTQAEWIEETVRHCVAQDAVLVVRHHPNNAREGIFCKAFLRQMLDISRRFPGNVRVVMPSEQITSYGLMWNLDLAITAFTTMGAETAIRGIPNICVSESLYREMGMEYTTDPSAYAEAIRRGLARAPERGMAELESAYRFAHYLYFTSNLRFKSYGIANVYSGEIRIKALDELMPGNDEALDKVCDHILAGTPLNIPTAERLSRSRAAEAEFLKAEWAFLEAQKAKARAVAARPPEPKLTVIRTRKSPDIDLSSEWNQSVRRTRLQGPGPAYLDLPEFPRTAAWLRALADTVAGLGTEYVYLGSEEVVPDESLFSESMDYLSDPSHAAIQHVAWGGWVCDPDGDIQGRVLTGKSGMTWDEVKTAMPNLEEPANLLALVVARAPDMAERLDEWARAAENHEAGAPQMIFNACFRESPETALILVPALAIHPERDPEQAEEEDIAFLFEMSGELGKAEKHYRKAIEKKPGDGTFLGRYREVLMRMGRDEDASRIMEKPQEPARDASWSAAPAGKAAPPRNYEEIASQVESVKGWLLAGQEKFLFDKVRSLPDGAVIIEMGANKGRSTCAMAFACLGTRKRIYSIDTFSGNDGVMGRDNDFETEWYGNLKRLGLEKHATPLKGFTFDVLPHRDRFPAPHFVFIDASHEYMDVLADFKGIYDYVVDGGWIAFHDVEASWPGPWRVWQDYALHMLTDHEKVATLACGRKPKTVPFSRAMGARPGFSFSDALIREMDGIYGAASALSLALRASKQGRKSTPQEAQVLAQAEVRIAESKEADFRAYLVNMMSVKDAGIDGFIRLWYGLTLIAEAKVPEAFTQLSEAVRASYPIPAHRAEPYLQLVRQAVPGQALPEPAPGDPAAAAYAGFVRPGDTVVEFLSGKGEVLRGISCAARLGVEPDRENRKHAINEFGLDSVEEAGELPDACADLIFCHGKLDREESPLASLQALAPKLKAGGKVVIRVRENADSIFAWTPNILGNLARAAGFRPLGEAMRDEGGYLRIVMEKN